MTTNSQSKVPLLNGQSSYSMNNPTVNVSDFTTFPGPRYKKLGSYSGEEFRDNILIPRIRKYGRDLVVNLDGVMGYGSSFLEETFGGAIRAGIDPDVVLNVAENVICNDEPELKTEIISYVKDQMEKLQSE